MGKKEKIFYGWWIVFAANLICMTSFGTWLYAFPSFFGPMIKEFGWNRAQLSGAASFRSVHTGIAGPIVGWLVDKYGSRRVIRVGGLLAGIGFISMTQVNSLISFYLIFGIVVSIGMSGITYIPVFTVIAKWFAKRLSFTFSILAIGAAVGGTIWTPTAAWLITNFGWRSAFLVIGICIWIIVIPMSFIIVEKPEDKGLRIDNLPPEEEEKTFDENGKIVRTKAKKPEIQPDFTAKEALSSSTFWMLAGSWFFQAMAFNVVFVHGVVAITDMGIDYMEAAALIGSITTLSLIGRLGMGTLADYIDKRYILFLAYCMIGMGIFALAFARHYSLVYLFIALYGIGYGTTIPVMGSLRAEYFGRTALGKIQGFMSPIAMLAGATGPVVVGYIFDTTGSYKYAFSIVATCAIIGGCVILFAKPKNLPGTPIDKIDPVTELN
jgi:MFS family permease